MILDVSSVCGFEGISGILSKAKYSSIAQWQSIRLLTEGLLVRAQLGEFTKPVNSKFMGFFFRQ